MRVVQHQNSFPYNRYTKGKLNVAGTVFKAAPRKATKPNHTGLPAAAFMAVRTIARQHEPPEFGVIRQVLLVPQPGYTHDTISCISDLLVYVDWFNPVPPSRSIHPTLLVPVICQSFVPASCLGMGNLWKADKITPVNITLMPSICPITTSDAVKTFHKNKYVVLSRDARLTELSHPAWSPNPEDPKLERYARTMPAGTAPDEIQRGAPAGGFADVPGFEVQLLEEAGDEMIDGDNNSGDEDDINKSPNESVDGNPDDGSDIDIEEELNRWEEENNPGHEVFDN